jgi:hypothetical protein
MLYTDLTPSQQQQAQHDLFHDDLFNVDSTRFDYIVDAGVVTGRTSATLATDRKQLRNQSVLLVSTSASALDEDARFKINCAINDLARQVAMQLVASQKESIYVS